MVASRDNFPLLAELLGEQQRLQTPVSRFSAEYDAGTTTAFAPQLIPFSAPLPGQQYAFEVELDSCTGCKACVSACHSLNGLDEEESWRDVGLILGGSERAPFQQTVTTACHHCSDPACLNGCPVLAYEKDPVTGVVRHLDDQCIGCQYCVLKCPYDVPKYNARLGIVRKCDLCQNRLSVGEAPACAQACPTHAIRVVVVNTSRETVMPQSPEPAANSRSEPTVGFLSAAPSPEYTWPTTRYLTRRRLPEDLRAADEGVLRVQPTHWPLAWMLTLLPFAVGTQLFTSCADFDSLSGGEARFALWASWTAGLCGLAASVAHLGQPLRAWRIFLGWRRSWLSREAVLFGLWFGVTTTALTVSWLLPLAAAVGLAGLLCSAMIYVDTRRTFWRAAQTFPRLLGSTILLGAAAAFAGGLQPIAASWALGAATLLMIAVQLRALSPANADSDAPITPALISARLLAAPLRALVGCRIVVAVASSLLLPAMVIAGAVPDSARWFVLLGALGGELADRALFFRAVDAPKMPGLPA